MSSLLFLNEETVSQTASEINNEENKIVLSSLPVNLVFTIFTFLPNEKKIKDNKQTQLKLLAFNVYDRVLLRRQCRNPEARGEAKGEAKIARERERVWEAVRTISLRAPAAASWACASIIRVTSGRERE